MKFLNRAVLAVAITLFNHGGTLMAQSAPTPIKNVVLVHGAFADGSSYAKIIPILQAKGLHVVSVQIPLTSFADDVAATKRAIDAQNGPVVLVGHSYGGVVISEAGNDPKVSALVYLAAFAPDSDQNIIEISKSFPKPPGMDTLAPQADGFLLLTEQGVKGNFAQDLTETEKNVLVAVQPMTAGAIFAAKVSKAAWHDKPTWYVVSSDDRMISPEQEKSMAKQMNASTIVLPASHVVMLSHPKEVAGVIEKATTLTK